MRRRLRARHARGPGRARGRPSPPARRRVRGRGASQRRRNVRRRCMSTIRLRRMLQNSGVHSAAGRSRVGEHLHHRVLHRVQRVVALAQADLGEAERAGFNAGQERLQRRRRMPGRVRRRGRHAGDRRRRGRHGDGVRHQRHTRCSIPARPSRPLPAALPRGRVRRAGRCRCRVRARLARTPVPAPVMSDQSCGSPGRLLRRGMPPRGG